MNNWLSVVVIGRNESEHLPKLYASLKEMENIIRDIIYVDSASTDDSAEISQRFCRKVIRLKASPFLSASLGRHMGTLEALGEWILYLDGDMEIESEFMQWLYGFDPTATADDVAGYVGTYRSIDMTSGAEKVDRHESRHGTVTHFGGAVLLSRAVTVEAGNWAFGVVANEEIELYARIRSLGYKVKAMDLPMVKHYTPLYNRLSMLKDLFWPGSGNRKYFGIGQAVVSAVKNGKLRSFIRTFPFPFVFLLVNLSCLMALVFGLADALWMAVAVVGGLQLLLLKMASSLPRFIYYHALSLRLPYVVAYAFSQYDSVNNYYLKLRSGGQTR